MPLKRPLAHESGLHENLSTLRIVVNPKMGPMVNTAPSLVSWPILISKTHETIANKKTFNGVLSKAYLEKDARDMKAKMEAESKALQEKLDKEASALKDKLTEGEEARRKESKALQDKLEKDKEALAKQVFYSSNISLFLFNSK